MFLLATQHWPTTHPWMWIGFILFMFAALAVDLLTHRKSSSGISTRTALAWSAVWIGLALGFAVLLFFALDRQSATDFLTGYLTEESLSVDNLFVFVLVFSYFKIPPQHQHRVLMWGIFGAMIMRAGMILIGAGLVQQFRFTLAFFGVFLVYTGIKLLGHDEEEADPSQSAILRWVRRVLPMARETNESSSGSGRHRSAESAGSGLAIPAQPGVANAAGVSGRAAGISGRTARRRKDTAFFVKEDGRWKATTYFLVLVVIELSDVVFAVDSVPAIFGAISHPPDPYIVFTSNMFAILGLRTLYFVIAAAIQHLQYLKYGLSLVLCFIGVKMLLPFLQEGWRWTQGLAQLPEAEKLHIPSELSLLVVVGILGVTAAVSLLHKPSTSAAAAEPEAPPQPAAPPTATPPAAPSEPAKEISP